MYKVCYRFRFSDEPTVEKFERFDIAFACFTSVLDTITEREKGWIEFYRNDTLITKDSVDGPIFVD